MQEYHSILVPSTNLLSICECKSNFFSVIIPEPTRKLYGRSVEWSVVEADFTYIEKCIKLLLVILSFRKNFENWSL